MLTKMKSGELDKVAKKEKGLYMMKFGSESCGPCQAMKPVLSKLAEGNSNINIYDIDTDESPDLGAHFEIRSIPTIFFCKNREILYTFNGATPLGSLQFVIDNIDDPYFKEHGEFKKPDEKKDYTYPLIVGGMLIFFFILYIFL